MMRRSGEEEEDDDGLVKARRVLRRTLVGVVDVRVPICAARDGSRRARRRERRRADSLDLVKMRARGRGEWREGRVRLGGFLGVEVVSDSEDEAELVESESESDSELESSELVSELASD